MGFNLKITESIDEYIKKNSKSLHPIQKEIISYNRNLGEVKKMQITLSQCYFLELIVKITNFKNILEIGTFTGLSTLSMALSLSKDGKIVALDKDPITNEAAVGFFKKANQQIKIKTIINTALDSLNQLKKNNKIFDMIFIDADKENYKNYYNHSLELINKDGLIIVDNVLCMVKL